MASTRARLSAPSPPGAVPSARKYRLFVYPFVQGRGRRLSRDGCDPARLTLLEANPFRGGVTYSRHVAA